MSNAAAGKNTSAGMPAMAGLRERIRLTLIAIVRS